MAVALPRKPRTVLIAIDGGEYAKYAFDWYCNHMHLADDNIIMVHSFEFHDVLQISQWLYAPVLLDKQTLTTLMNNETMSLKEQLEHFADMMRKKNLHGTVKGIHASKPGEGIINAAKDNNADIIITGSRGTGKLRRTFLGSVSDYILHHSDVPVVVCRHKDHHKHHRHDNHGRNHNHHEKQQ